MGACVTPNKTPANQRIPLPTQNNVANPMNSQARPLSVSGRNSTGIRQNSPNNIPMNQPNLPNLPNLPHQPNQPNQVVPRPETSFLARNSGYNPMTPNQQVQPVMPNNVIQTQINTRRTYQVDPIIEQPSSSIRNIQNQTRMSLNSPRNGSTRIYTPIIRKDSLTRINQQIQPQSIANTVQTMVDNNRFQSHIQNSPNRGSAVNRLQEVISYESKQLVQNPIHNQINYANLTSFQRANSPAQRSPVDKRLLSFNKNVFSTNLSTPTPQSFKYNISLPLQNNTF